MIRMTKLTRQIIQHIESYRFATSYQIANIFYKNNKCGVEQARKKLKLLADHKILDTMTTPFTGKELMYFIKGNKKPISYHRYLLLNFYSQIYKACDEVEYFKLEETWQISNKRSDAHIIFNYNGYKYSYLIEVDVNHATQPEKYIEIYDSQEVHQWYLDKYNESLFPMVIIINALGTHSVASNDSFEVIGLDFSLSDLTKKVIA